MIRHNKATIGSKEIKSVKRVLESGWLASGKAVERFETEFSKYLDAKNGLCVAVSSGTAALYLSLISLGIRDNDEVIIPSYVCSAVLNAINLCRAKAVLVDINADDLNISTYDVKKKLSKKTKAIIITHTFGVPANIDLLLKSGIHLIEDCAQALGSKFKGKLVGNFGTVSIFSFYVSKIITTGYGGMIFSKDKKIINRVRDYLEFDGKRDYIPRFNFQMSDINAALGRIQLGRLSSFLKRRAIIADGYYRLLPEKNAWPYLEFKENTNYYRFLVRDIRVNGLKNYLNKNGVQSILPIQKFELLHRYLKLNPRDFKNCERVAETTLSLPIYPSLTKQEFKKIKKLLTNFNL